MEQLRPQIELIEGSRVKRRTPESMALLPHTLKVIYCPWCLGDTIPPLAALPEGAQYKGEMCHTHFMEQYKGYIGWRDAKPVLPPRSITVNKTVA